MVCPFQRFGRVAATIVFGLIAGRIQSTAADESVSYYGKIKPLLAGHCHKCHGSGTQKAGLRLDSLKAALAGGKSGSPAIIPGKSRESEMIRRITSQDPDEQMPPKGKGSKLTESEIELIKH